MRMVKELRGRTDAELNALVPYFDEVAIPAGTRLAQEGRVSHQFFIVVEGVLQTRRQGGCGTLEMGESFGWNAMRERGWDAATVTALSNARVLVMGHAQLRAAKALVGEPAASSEPAPSRRLAG